MESVESNAILRFLSYYNDIETLASLGPFFCEYSSLNILLIGYEKHFVFYLYFSAGVKQQKSVQRILKLLFFQMAAILLLSTRRHLSVGYCE